MLDSSLKKASASGDAIRSSFQLLPPLIERELPAILAMRSHRVSKADGSYVTEGDLLVQDLVLRFIDQSFPAARIVSEELKEPVGETGAACVFVIDPIDGTENFTSGLPEWGVSIACYEHGKHAFSLIGCPEMRQWLSTGDGCARFTSRIRGLSSSLTKEDLLAATSGYEYRVLGCCVYNMLNVIRGSFYSFENPKGANSWDILAGLNLALEHGLAVTVEGKQYAGEYLPADRKYRFKVGQ
jgi:fructose-1,6-bisphosphatase/inositol monophosphatase family enzyme